MPLAQTLSALRTLILDESSLPASESDRQHYYRERFPSLSSEEVEDLAKIPPKRLAIYTESIFSSERSLLRSKFPLTFALIRRERQLLGDRPLDTYELTRSLHKEIPWRSNLVPELVSNFLNYLVAHPELGKLTPYLLDVAGLENKTVLIARALWGLPEGWQAVEVGELSNLTVAQVMELSFIIPEYVESIESGADIAALWRTYRNENKLLEEGEFLVGHTCLVGARTPAGHVRWLSIPLSVFEAIKGTPQGQVARLEEFADRYLETQSAVSDPQQLFQQFLLTLIQLINVGAIFLLKKP